MGLFSKRATDQPADNVPAPAAEYRVTYKGGLAALPKAKIGGIELRAWLDRFDLAPTTASRKFWQPLTIPYSAVSDVQVVRRQVSTGETLLAGNNARNLAQDNNIHLHYWDASGQPTVLRVEMLTGVTVQGQAKKAAEFNDLLQAHGIRRLFTAPPAAGSTPPRGPDSAASTTAGAGAGSLADELRKLQELLQDNVLSPEEFAAAKARLLG